MNFTAPVPHHVYVAGHCMASFDRQDVELCLEEAELSVDQLRELVNEHNAWHGCPLWDELMA